MGAVELFFQVFYRFEKFYNVSLHVGGHDMGDSTAGYSVAVH